MTVTAPPRPATVALIGNPNTGKTTIFNLLTGLHQRVGNYPGVTVSRKEGTVMLSGGPAKVIDLPGSYSLSAASADERIAVDVLTGRVPGTQPPDAVVCVVDACNILRNLFLASQVAELGLPMVIILNQSDQARRKGIHIDADLLSERLGVPVVPMVAKRREGYPALLEAMQTILDEPRCFKRITWPACVQEASQTLRQSLPAGFRETLSEAECHRILFDANSALLQRIGWHKGVNHERDEALGRARRIIQRAGYNPMAAEALLHYQHLGGLLEGVVRQEGEATLEPTESIDKLMVHRGWGLVIFAAIMYLVFLSVYSWAGPFMDGIEWAKGWLQETVAPSLSGTPMFQSLMVDGVIEGVGAFVVFLPQILILFFFIALLEDSGYLARAAFLMDRLFSWCGLNGKSFVPLLSSYACAVPGILAARTIEDPKSRLATVLIAPFMSCSARLPVYILMIGAFIEPKYGPFVASIVLFGMHIVGLLVAIPTAFILNRFVLKTQPHPFLLELPEYRVPRLKDVSWRMIQSGQEFVKKAGTIIFAITIVIWALLYFPRPASVEQETRATFVSETAAALETTEEAVQAELANDDSDLQQAYQNTLDGAYMEQSYMAKMGKSAQPIFAWAGFDWKITVGVLASFPAREVIISTLGVIYKLGGDVDEENADLRTTMARAEWPSGPLAGTPIFSLPVVIAIMVFFALCSQCGATLAVIAKEVGAKWAVFSFVYMTTCAWLGAVVCFQVGSRLL